MIPVTENSGFSSANSLILLSQFSCTVSFAGTLEFSSFEATTRTGIASVRTPTKTAPWIDGDLGFKLKLNHNIEENNKD